MTQTSTDSGIRWHRVSPTPSYSIELPADCAEDIDGSVLSYWRPNDTCALQISSYRRASGDQVTARERLAARISRDEAGAVAPVQLALPYPDYAAALGTDEQNVTWLYIYITWPSLSLFVTISGTKSSILDERGWARRALASVRAG